MNKTKILNNFVILSYPLNTLADKYMKWYLNIFINYTTDGQLKPKNFQHIMVPNRVFFLIFL